MDSRRRGNDQYYHGEREQAIMDSRQSQGNDSTVLIQQPEKPSTHLATLDSRH